LNPPPQTQGKIERYHLTLKSGFDRFVHIYNEESPAFGSRLPTHASLASARQGHRRDRWAAVASNTKVRRARIDKTGCFTLRHRSKLHHVGVGRAHRGSAS
jgi:hypothetical protein